MKKLIRFLLLLLYVLFNTSNVGGCTGITLKGKDGSVVFGRTLEWGGTPLNSDAIIVPRGYNYRGLTPTGKNGLKWSVKYAFVGLNLAQKPLQVAEGLNEKGLAVGAFYFPGYAQYESYNKRLNNKTISPIEFPVWLLSNFATVQELRDGVSLSRVVPVVLKELGFVPPLHYIVTDASGASVVLEYIKGKLTVHDNPIGIITNSPTFDWHLTNVRNYVGLAPWNKPSVFLGGMTFQRFGQGGGMFGLPGSFTAPARFVRATLLAKFAFPGKGGYETVEKVFHVLNQFDIPDGAVRNQKGKSPQTSEVTEWTSASDTKAKRFYFHTVKNRQIRMIDLQKANLDAKDIVTVPVCSVAGTVEDVTPKAR